MPAFSEKRIGEKFFNDLIFNVFELVDGISKERKFSYTSIIIQLAEKMRDGAVDAEMLEMIHKSLITSTFTELMLDPIQNSLYTKDQLTVISKLIADNVLARAEVVSEKLVLGLGNTG